MAAICHVFACWKLKPVTVFLSLGLLDNATLQSTFMMFTCCERQYPSCDGLKCLERQTSKRPLGWLCCSFCKL